MAHAFIAKAVWNLPGTKDIIEHIHANARLRRLCGWSFEWEIPSESTFSRAFAQFAQMQLPQKIHEALVNNFLSEDIVCHVSRDSTKIDAPEIHAFSQELNHVPLIDHNRRRGEKRQFEPDRAERYKARSSVERVNSNLKDNYGGRHVRVKGNAKAACENWV